MAQAKPSYQCTQCYYKTIRWVGLCPECKTFNSIEIVAAISPASGGLARRSASLSRLSDLAQSADQKRFLTGIDDWDRVLGGGLMQNSLTILAGEPGIGKSTLLLSVAAKLSMVNSVAYFCTEEVAWQVRERAVRIGAASSDLFLSGERDFDVIETTLKSGACKIAIIDSIQGCFLGAESATSSASTQIKEIVFRLVGLSKENNVTVILSGHITKDGGMAGPKLVEHMVDTVLYFAGEETSGMRILSSSKNRFGAVGELGFWTMNTAGLEPIPDVNARTLAQTPAAPGLSLGIIEQSSRPLLVQMQALCVRSKLGIPQRIVSGADHKKVSLIAAILEKYLRLELSACDLFFKVGGGLLLKEASSDLAIALAILSSYLQKSLPSKSLAIGELALTGRVLAAPRQGQLVETGCKMGLETIVSGPADKKASNQRTITTVFELPELFE